MGVATANNCGNISDPSLTEGDPFYLCVAKNRTDILTDINVHLAGSIRKNLSFCKICRISILQKKSQSNAFRAGESVAVCSDTIVIGYLKGYLPYSDTAQNGMVTGVLKDIMPQMLSRLGISRRLNSIRYQEFTEYDAMLKALDQGSIDTAFPIYGDLWYSEQKWYHTKSGSDQLTD